MVNDAEKFKAEDEKQKERIAAKNGLESYCFNMKSTLEDEKLKDKISEDERKSIVSKCDDALSWLDSNQLADKDEFTDKQKEVEAVCNPIIAKLYQGGEGMPGGMPGVCLEVVCPEVLVLAVALELALPLRRSTNMWISLRKSIIEKKLFIW